MRYRSAKMVALYRQRRPLVAEILADRPWCEIRWDERCQLRSDCVHELRKRSQGGSILDPANLVAACHVCNGLVEDWPIQAHDRGFVLWAGESA